MSAVRQVHAARFLPFLALGLAAVAAASVHAQSDPFTDTLAPGGAALGYLLRWEKEMEKVNEYDKRNKERAAPAKA